MPISWDAVIVGQALPLLTLTVTQQDNEEYCLTHVDDLTLYRGTRGFVHPGILLRQCNRIFSEHFILGPWIHVASDITTYRPCQVGEALEIRGVPVQKFEKKGHEFVVLDILIRAADEAVQRVKHTYFSSTPEPTHSELATVARMGKGKAMKRSALYPLHQALGATFTTVGEWELPQHFGDPHAEYQAYDTVWAYAICPIVVWFVSQGGSGNVFCMPWSRMIRRACNRVRDATRLS